MRREFSKQVKREALKRANKRCEGENCGALFGFKFHFDHIIADGLGGEPTLENCAVLCHPCHNEKTRKHDVPLIAKVKRIQDKHSGIRNSSRMRSAGFRKAPAQLTASKPLQKGFRP
jgi:5-methylcytosine-specific restriction endonuclease McrA